MTPLLVVLWVLVGAAAWDAFVAPRFRHYRRMTPRVPPALVADPEFTWWSRRRSTREKLEHRRRFHIDLLARRKR